MHILLNYDKNTKVVQVANEAHVFQFNGTSLLFFHALRLDFVCRGGVPFCDTIRSVIY